MDKNWKLQRYNRKDYTDLVDFPVEIVGRDGVVRRYSFEDSIRLYQRRITFAPVRYRDDDLVDAEVWHCRSRIDQLRRSYFHRHGWGVPVGQDGPEAALGVLAGEVAAFLRRVLRSGDRPDVRFDTLGSTVSTSSWYIRPLHVPVGLILTVHRFEGEDADHVREGFFASLKGLERSGRVSGDGERLLAFHHTADCGLVLSGRGDEVEHLKKLQRHRDESRQTPTVWDGVMDLVRRGEHDAALIRCGEIAAEQPYHRRAYAIGSLLALHLERVEHAEELAFLGSRYFRSDPSLHFQLALARALRGDPRAAESAERAVALRPSMSAARLLLASLLVARGERGRARRILLAPVRRQDERRQARAARRLAWWLWWRTATRLAGFVSVALGLLLSVWVGPLGLLPVGLGLGMALLAGVLFRRSMGGVLSPDRFTELQAGLRRLHRADRSEPEAVA